MAIPADRNVVQMEAEKKLKYKSLGIEIERMWNMKCTIIPVITGATGIVTRSLKKNLQAIPGTHYKRRLYLEHHTYYGKHYSVKLQTGAVGFTAGSRNIPERKGL